MKKPFNVNLFLAIYLPLCFASLGYMWYRHYQKNYQVCELNDVSDIDTTKLYTFYKIDSLDLYMRNVKLDTSTVYDDSGKCYLQITIASPISSSKHTKLEGLYTAEDRLMMYQNEDYSYVQNFGPAYAWFGFSFECELNKSTAAMYGNHMKEKIIRDIMSEYRNMIVNDTNKYFTRIKDAYLYGIYKKMIHDSLNAKPIVLEFTYNSF